MPFEKIFEFEHIVNYFAIRFYKDLMRSSIFFRESNNSITFFDCRYYIVAFSERMIAHINYFFLNELLYT
jgi:hypothetical protein